MPRFMGFWRTRFAWWPAWMDDGRVVWLRRFEEREVKLGCVGKGDIGPFIMRRFPPERMIP